MWHLGAVLAGCGKYGVREQVEIELKDRYEGKMKDSWREGRKKERDNENREEYDWQFTYKRNIEARSSNHCCCGK